MTRHFQHRNASRRSLAAFAITVALAMVASVTQLLPDVTAQSADAMSTLPDGLDQFISAAAFE